jgi:hypothetical protein
VAPESPPCPHSNISAPWEEQLAIRPDLNSSGTHRTAGGFPLLASPNCSNRLHSCGLDLASQIKSTTQHTLSLEQPGTPIQQSIQLVTHRVQINPGLRNIITATCGQPLLLIPRRRPCRQRYNRNSARIVTGTKLPRRLAPLP